MPLSIGALNVDKISGPISLTYMTPTSTFKEFADDPNVCDILLLANRHHSVDQQCNDHVTPYEQTLVSYDITRHVSSVSMGLMSTGWYKLLDTIASPQNPIDYYVESFYPPDLLQQSDHILKTQGNPYTFDPSEAVMLYTIDKHFPCFTRTQEQIRQNMCMTYNIRYHVADIRYLPSQYNPNIVSSEFSLAHLEAQMNYCMTLCCFVPQEMMLHRNANIHAIDFLHQVAEDPVYFYQYLFNPKHQVYAETSLLYKQMKHHTEWQTIVKWHQFCLNYCVTCRNLAMSSPEYQKIITDAQTFLKGHNEQRKAILSIQHYATCASAMQEYKNKHQAIIVNFIHILFLPLFDLYFLLRCWRSTQSPRSWLAVLNAGNAHCHAIMNILQALKFYDVRIYQHNDTNQPKFRCVSLPFSVINQPWWNTRFLPTEKHRRLLDLLGQQLYLSILNGRPINHTELAIRLQGNKLALEEAVSLLHSTNSK